MTTEIVTVIGEAFDKLAAEGSADAIALRLHAEGVTGQRRRAYACPVSNWLIKTTGRRVIVRNGVWQLRTGNDGTHPVPAEVGYFTACFDNGRYAALAAAEAGDPR